MFVLKPGEHVIIKKGCGYMTRVVASRKTLPKTIAMFNEWQKLYKELTNHRKVNKVKTEEWTETFANIQVPTDINYLSNERCVKLETAL